MLKSVKKAVLLVAGEGKRFHPITETRPKPMIPIAGKPLLQYILEYLSEIGITDVLLIDGYRKEIIREHFRNGNEFGLTIEYKEQKQFMGTAHAANFARQFASDDPFMLIYGDLLMDKQILKDSVEVYKNSNANALINLFEVPDPEKYGIIQLDDSYHVQKIVEKPPDDRYGNLANAGIYIFDSKIFDGIDRTSKSQRGEYELTDSMQLLINDGYKILGNNIGEKYWSDVGHPWQLLDANKYILSVVHPKNMGKVDDDVVILGNVTIDKNAHIKSGCRIEGPAYIGKDTIIGPNAYIRPNTSVGNNCKIGNSCELKNTVVFDNTFIAHLSYAGDSIIGESVNFGAGTIVSNVRLDKKTIFMKIKGQRVNTNRHKMGAVIGDNVQLGINCSVMTGKKIGSNAVIGASTLVIEDIPKDTTVYVEQNLTVLKNREEMIK